MSSSTSSRTPSASASVSFDALEAELVDRLLGGGPLATHYVKLAEEVGAVVLSIGKQRDGVRCISIATAAFLLRASGAQQKAVKTSKNVVDVG